MVLHLMIDEFLLEKKLFSHQLQLRVHLNDLPHTMHVTSYGVSSLFSNVFNILHMNCLLEFRKITFTIHFFFTFLTGIIFRPLFDEITIHGNVKITFFMKSAWYRTWCLMNFFSEKMFSRIHCNFMLITFLNGLPHSKHVSSQDVC